MKYNMQNGFLNWGKLEMEMECDDLSWKKVLTQYYSFVLNSQLNTLPTPNNLRLAMGLSKEFELWALQKI